MATYQITAITMSGPGYWFDHITHAWTGSGKHFTVPEVITMIRDRGDVFYTVGANNQVALVEPVDAVRPYIRTLRDGTRTDNLLSLPRRAAPATSYAEQLAAINFTSAR